MSVLSIAGVPLRGTRLVRLTYFDDAGLFNAQQEPFIVIGGVIINGDNQLTEVEEHLDGLVDKHIPEEDRYGFVFHATELWSGGRYFKRESWPLEKRLEILSDLAALPNKLKTPLSFGYQSREQMAQRPNFGKMDPRTVELHLYSAAYLRFCESIERFMRQSAKDENTILIGEDNDAIRALAKVAHAKFRDPRQMEAIAPTLTNFPFERIRESVHFATKSESKSLQLADMCTFIVKRHLMKDPHIKPFFDALVPWLVVLPNQEFLEEQPS